MVQELCTAVSFALAGGGAFAISGGQVDDFESGSASFWAHGPSSPNPPSAVNEDSNWFLRNVSTGGSGPGSGMAFFNRAQWTGDYVSADVSAISMDVRNSGATDLHLRIGLLATSGTRSVTNEVFALDAGSGWQTATFDITDLTIFFGSETVTDILSGVIEMRIISSESVQYQADRIVATLDVDNITAVPAPGAGGVLVGACAFAGRRRR